MDRRNFLTGGAAIVVSQVIGAEALAQKTDASARSQINATYENAGRCMTARDISGLKAMMTADCILIANGVKLTRDEWEKQMTPFFASAQKIRFTHTIQSVKVTGNTAQVTVKQTLGAKVPDASGKLRQLESVEVSRDTLTLVGKNWLLKRSEAISHTETLDGKPAPAAK